MFANTGRSVTIAVLLTAATCIVAAQGPASPEKLQETLVAQENKLLDVIESKDRAAITKLLGDQALAVTLERGRQTTAEHIAALASISVKDFEVSEAKAIQVTPDVAILNFKLSWTDNRTQGKSTPMGVFATVVWKLVDGQWRSVFYQETPLAK